MAWYPKAVRRPVPLINDPDIIPVGVILHVSGGEASSLFNYFNGPSGGIESHMHLNRQLQWEQYRDTTQEADANYRGNSWIGPDGRRYGFISVETQGTATGRWSEGMVAELIDFCRWAAATHNFPLQKAAGYRSPGLGYHVMFGSGPGTNSWSNATGKVCPGSDRIQQFENVILPALMGKGFLMGLSDDEQRRVLGASELAVAQGTNITNGIKTIISLIQGLDFVDEAEIAKVLAPLLEVNVTALSDEDVARIAKASADELGRRAVNSD